MLNVIKEAFFSWLWLFGAPIKDSNVLWIIIPIWVSWFFTEFFQEKKGTHFGNAITNGAVSIWVSIDWFRHLTNRLEESNITTDYTLYIKFGIATFILLFGILVIINGLNRNKFANFGGRIRVITYILVMFTPIIYETAQITTMNIVAIFAFFPLYYFILELIVYVVPDSKALEDDEGKTSPLDKRKDEKSPFGSEKPFGSDINSPLSSSSNPFENKIPSENPFENKSPSENPFENNKQENNPTSNPFNKPQPQNTGQNPFDRPSPQNTGQNPFRPQPSSALPPNRNTNNLNNNPMQNRGSIPQQKPPFEQQKPQTSQQEYKEPDFDTLPNSNDIWEKIKRKNAL